MLVIEERNFDEFLESKPWKFFFDKKIALLF